MVGTESSSVAVTKYRNNQLQIANLKLNATKTSQGLLIKLPENTFELQIEGIAKIMVQVSYLGCSHSPDTNLTRLLIVGCKSKLY